MQFYLQCTYSRRVFYTPLHLFFIFFFFFFDAVTVHFIVFFFSFLKRVFEDINSVFRPPPMRFYATTILYLSDCMNARSCEYKARVLLIKGTIENIRFKAKAQSSKCILRLVRINSFPPSRDTYARLSRATYLYEDPLPSRYSLRSNVAK